MDEWEEYLTITGRSVIAPHRPPHQGPMASGELLLEWAAIMADLGEPEEAFQAAADAVQLGDTPRAADVVEHMKRRLGAP